MRGFQAWLSDGAVHEFEASRYEVGDSIISAVLGEAGVTLDCRIVPLMRKDSLEITASLPVSEVCVLEGRLSWRRRWYRYNCP